jgi:hypothetical protein
MRKNIASIPIDVSKMKKPRNYIKREFINNPEDEKDTENSEVKEDPEISHSESDHYQVDRTKESTHKYSSIYQTNLLREFNETAVPKQTPPSNYFLSKREDSSKF